jgi:uncharacterized protein
MSLSMYQASVPAFIAMLKNLDAILEKAEAFAKERNIEESVLLNWRLAPDMFAFTRQIQLATDFAKGTTARLAGAEVPSYADDEASFAGLRQRIAKTVSFVQTFKPADIDGSEGRDITLTAGGRELRFKGSALSFCTLHCRISIFTPPSPTISCAPAAWGSASLTSSVRSKSRTSRRACSGS